MAVDDPFFGADRPADDISSTSLGPIISATDTRVDLVGTLRSSGVDPDNEDAALARASTLGQAAGCITLELDGARKYGLTLSQWTRLLPFVRIKGNGAEIQNVNDSNIFSGDTGVMNSNPGLHQNQTTDPHTPGTWHNGYKISTVAAGATSVTCTTAAEADNFSIGDWVYISSRVIQTTGAPPNCLYKDFARVRSVNIITGVITLWKPLKWKHRSDQWDFNAGVGNYTTGAARIRLLNRGSGFTFCEHLYMENLTLLDNTGNPDEADNGGFGQLYITGTLRAELNNVKAGNFVPSECGQVISTDCDFKFIEIDKAINSAHFIRGEIGRLTGGSGSDEIILDHVTLRGDEAHSVETGVFIADKCIISGPDDTGSSTAQFSIAATETFIFGTIDRRQSTDAAGKFFVPAAVATLPALTAVASTVVQFTRDLGDQWGGMYQLRIGCLVYKGSSPTGVRGVIKDLYYNSGTGKEVLEVHAWLGGTPSVSDTLNYRPNKTFQVVGTMDLFGNHIRNITGNVAFPDRVQVYSNPSEYLRAREIFFPLPNDASPYDYTPNGTVREIEIAIVTAQAGKTVNIPLIVNAAPAWAIDTVYATGVLRSNGGKNYYCTTGGTSAHSGGPTGTGGAITDNTCTWAWAGTVGTEQNLTISATTVHVVKIDQFGVSGMTTDDSFGNQYGSVCMYGGTANYVSSGTKSLSMGGGSLTCAGYFRCVHVPINV